MLAVLIGSVFTGIARSRGCGFVGDALHWTWIGLRHDPWNFFAAEVQGVVRTFRVWHSEFAASGGLLSLRM